MKKLITYLLLIILLSGVLLSSTSSAFAEHNPEYSQEMLDIAKKVLIDLGYWRDFTEDDTYLTRAEAAEISCRICGFDYEVPLEIYTDVPTYHWASNWIKMAYYNYDIIGLERFYIMEGDGNGIFRPDEYITYQDFAKVLVSSLGWAPYIKYNENGYPHDYPDGFLKVADLLGLYPLPEDKYTEPLTKDDAIILMYNLLKAPRASFTLGSPGYCYKVIDWNRQYKDAARIRGYCKKIDDNTLSVDGVIYTGKVNSNDFSEGYIVGYYEDKYYRYIGRYVPEEVRTMMFCYPISSLDFDNAKPISDELPSDEFWLLSPI